MTQHQQYPVFISYYHEEDQGYKEQLVQMMGNRIEDCSVDIGNIVDTGLHIDEIRRQIRDDFIADATVTIVLIGPRTWQRKHVDWEIHASLRDTDHNERCGLLGILLPDHPNFRRRPYNLHLIPQRLAYNCAGNAPYARIRYWTQQPGEVQSWIRKAFNRSRHQPDPDTSLTLFADNRTTEPLRGWQ